MKKPIRELNIISHLLAMIFGAIIGLIWKTF